MDSGTDNGQVEVLIDIWRADGQVFFVQGFEAVLLVQIVVRMGTTVHDAAMWTVVM